MKWLSYFIFIAVSLIASITYADSFTTATAPQVSEFRLANGLQILVQVDNRSPVVVSQVWYKVGGSYEPDGITGISHVLEHMMFQGTPKFPKGQFMSIIASKGGMLNAATDYDYTYYYEELPAADLATSFMLEADRMQHLDLTAAKFSKELQVVKEERGLRTDNNPQMLTFERFFAAANIASPYHHPIVGWMNDLNNMQLSDALNWYHTWYAPNNAILVVVGNVNPQQVYQLAQQYFGSIPAKQLPTIKPFTEVPMLGERQVQVNLPAQLPFLLMGYNVPVVTSDPIKWEPYALTVAQQILAGSDSSRLQQTVVRKLQIAADVGGEYNTYARLPFPLFLMGVPTPGHTAAELEQAFLAQIKLLQTTSVTPAELARAKAQIISQTIFMRDSLSDEATLLGSLASVGLPWQEEDNFVTQIQAITAQQVQAVAQKYFTENNLTVAILNPITVKN